MVNFKKIFLTCLYWCLLWNQGLATTEKINLNLDDIYDLAEYYDKVSRCMYVCKNSVLHLSMKHL